MIFCDSGDSVASAVQVWFVASILPVLFTLVGKSSIEDVQEQKCVLVCSKIKLTGKVLNTQQRARMKPERLSSVPEENPFQSPFRKLKK